MSTFIFRRFLIFFPMLFFMSIMVFAIIQAPPGDYVSDRIRQMELSGESVRLEEARAMRMNLGLDKPLHVQYYKWVKGVVTWNFGRSLYFGQNVNKLISERLVMTVIMGLLTIMFVWTLSIPIGLISAVKQYSIIDYVFTFMSYIGVGTPNFMLAIIMMYGALVFMNLSITGLYSYEYIDTPWSVGKFVNVLKHIWVPMIIIGTDGTAGFTRIMRANLLDEMSKPYVETARAKGLPELRLILKYPTRMAFNPLISSVGWALPALFSGDAIVGTILNLPTIGPLLLQALFFQDLHMAGSILLILTGLTLIGTLISDIVLAWFDPRIRMEES